MIHSQVIFQWCDHRGLCTELKMLAFNETLYFKFIIHPFVGVRVGILDGEHKTDKKPTLRLGIKV